MKIIPHLWFDTQAIDAAEFYADIFPDSSLEQVRKIRDTPSGDCDIVSFRVWGLDMMAINAGPGFALNPAISFLVNFDPSTMTNAQDQLDLVWQRLSEGGTVLMPLQEYDFSAHYGWVQDRYGVSWQLMLTNPDGDPRPAVIPSMLFSGKSYGQAAAATEHYISVFDNTRRGQLVSREDGTTLFTDIQIGDLWIAAMDGEGEHEFGFNEAFSFIVRCETQDEIDRYWNALSAVPESEQCGWLKDKFGVSWQIDSSTFEELMDSGSEAQRDLVTQAMLQMKKFDIAALEAAAAAAD